MNEIVFFCQLVLIIAFLLAALKLGRAALTSWIAILALMGNFFLLKQITLFGLDVTASDNYAIGSLLGLNLLQERYGQREAFKASYSCLFFMAFFTLLAQLHLLYQHNLYDTSHTAYALLLTPAPRFFIASLATLFFVQQFDIRFFSWLKSHFPQANFSLRIMLSLFLSQCLDTVIFSIAGLYGIAYSLVSIIIMSLAIKLVTIAALIPLTRWAAVRAKVAADG